MIQVILKKKNCNKNKHKKKVKNDNIFIINEKKNNNVIISYNCIEIIYSNK